MISVLSISGALGFSPTALHSGSVGGGTTAGGTTSTGPDSTPLKHAAGTVTGDTLKHQTTPGPHRPADQQSTALPSDSGTGKRVVFDVSAQRVWLVDDQDSTERTYLVSGSKFHNLELGTYHVYSRSSTATAYNSDETMQYMVRFATGRTSPIGFHSIPAYSNGTLVEARSSLGTPQSDGCIRQWITDAKAMWDFAAIGTTVLVRA